MRIIGIIVFIVLIQADTFCMEIGILRNTAKREIINDQSKNSFQIRKQQASDLQEEHSRNSALKFDFFSPLRGCFAFSFETAYRDHITIDAEAGYIGIKPHNLNVYKNYSDYNGAYIAIGARYYLKRDDEKNDLQGIYFKPEILANYFVYERQHFLYDSVTTFHEFVPVKGTDMSLGLLICSGAQLLLSDFLIMDVWAGFGYGGNWISENSDLEVEEGQYFINQYNKFSHWQILRTNMIVDCGLSIGILIR